MIYIGVGLYCSMGRLKIVLQYNYCIAGKRRLGWKCITIHWFVLQKRGLKLYCRCSIVLQYSGVQGFKTVLQYSLVGSRFLLQYKLYCELG